MCPQSVPASLHARFVTIRDINIWRTITCLYQRIRNSPHRGENLVLDLERLRAGGAERAAVTGIVRKLRTIPDSAKFILYAVLAFDYIMIVWCLGVT